MSEFQQLLRGVADGSESACEELVSKYGDYIYFAVRRHLNQKLRTLFDSEDFYQAVWKSVMSNREDILRCKEPEDLVAFLKTMARNKVVDESRRRLMAQKRNMNRERHLDCADNEHLAGSLTACEPTPSEHLMGRERLESLLEGQSATHQQIIRLLADGASQGEVAKAVNCSERTVRRVVRGLSSRLES